MATSLLITSKMLIMQPKNYAAKGKKQAEVKVFLYGPLLYYRAACTAMQKESDSPLVL
jgi:hypothetical protein